MIASLSSGASTTWEASDGPTDTVQIYNVGTARSGMVSGTMR